MVPKTDVMVILTGRVDDEACGIVSKKAEIMTFGERELEAARQQILQRMQNTQSYLS
jgi:hypothetical protein